VNKTSQEFLHLKTDVHVLVNDHKDCHIPVTQAPEIHSICRRRFLVRVSCKSGTGFNWYKIPAPISTLFYSKPESGVHMT